MLQFKSLNDLANELNNNVRKSLLGSDDDQFQDEQKHKQITVNKICKQIMFVLFRKNMNFYLIFYLRSWCLVVSGKGANTIDSNAKVEMLGLYKKQKELLTKNLEIKKRQLEEIQTKQKVSILNFRILEYYLTKNLWLF